MCKKIFLIAIVLLLLGCSKYVSKTNHIDSLIINKFNFEEKINISSIYKDVNGVVIFYEYGRPDMENSNTIIGAHSGTGFNEYFNFLEKLKIDDEVLLFYNNGKYIYKVEKIEIVDEKNLDPLKNKEYSILTLMTCKIGDSSKRVIVISKLVSVI